MPCDCNKPKDDGKCGVSPAVMQVNNNNCTLFHRVDVPVAMGDEKVNPPKIGTYKNVLLYYEASGNSYLYSSDGIPTKLTGVVSDYEVLLNKPWINGVELIGHKTLADLGITGAISGAVAAEANARESADNELSNRITANTNAINAEKTARQNADTALGNRITGVANDLAAETTARQNADTTLGNRITANTNAINTEKTARENADTALSNRITTNTNNIATNTSAIATETTNRQNADNALSTRITSNTTAINNEKTARQNADTALGQRIDGVAGDISAEAIARENADDALSGRIDGVAATANSAVQPSDIDRVVMTDISVDSSSSATQVKLKEAKVNLKTGTTSSQTTTLPVASSTAAGVMNAATYDAVTNNTNNINAILGGAVAINGLSANPSQSDLTTAWQNETGLSTLINRATIYDVTNSKVWTYYTNDTTWYATTSASTITVNTFTNSSEGVIKGSTADGQVFAENDGTGSVNGWGALTNDVANATTKLAGIQDGAEANVQADWNEADSAADDYIKNKPTIGNATLTIQKNGVNVQTFTANATSNKTANITVPTKTSELTNDSGFIEDDTHAVCGDGSIIALSGTTLEPLEVHEVGGNTTQKTLSGKNLFSGDFSQFDNQGGTGSTYAYFKLPTDGDYSLTLTAKNNIEAQSPQKFLGFSVNGGDASSGFVWLFSGSTTATKGQIFTKNNTYSSGKYGCVSMYPKNAGTLQWFMDNFEIQLEAGSTSTDYEEYCGGIPSPNPDYPQTVNTVTGEQTIKIAGKNLFNKAQTPKFNKGTTISQLETGVRATQTVAGTFRYSIFVLPIKVEEGKTYTFSVTMSPSASNIGRIAVCISDADGGNRQVKFYQDSTGWDKFTATNADLAHPYICLLVYSNLDGTGNVDDYVDYTDIQLELSNSPSSFEPYQEQSYTISLGSIELAKIGNYQDYIWNDDGTWKIHKEVGKVVFDGSEAWTLSSNTNLCRTDIPDALVVASGSTIAPALSDYFTASTWVKLSDGTVDYGLAMYYSAGRIALRNKTFTTKNDYTTWLSTHNTTVYYALATPTDTEITDSTLISQLEALWEADGADEATNIIITSISGVPATIAVCQYPSHIPVATKYKIGAVVVGHGLDIEPDGRLDVIPATERTIGGIKVGENLSITEDGVLSADAQHIEVDDTLSTASENPVQNKVITTALNAKADASALSTVATTGAYNDLSGKPTIGDATLTIQQNGTDVQTFTANATSNKTANITVPTKTSDLDNDSNFISNDTHAVCDEGDSIILTGTTLEPLEMHSVNGTAEQTTISGKNLFNIDDLVDTNNTTYTQDGWATATYDNSEGSSAIFCNFFTTNIPKALLPEGTDCSIVTEIKSVSGSGTIYSVSSNSTTQFTTQRTHAFSTLSAGMVVVDTNTSKADYTGTGRGTRTYVRFAAGESGSVTYRISVIKGTTVTPQDFVYTPFTGGSDSPNPSYPQTINTVSGAQTVKITGKNLAEMQNGDAITAGITASRSSTTGEVILNGTSTSTATINASTLYTIPIVAGETYTISANNAEANSSVSIRLNIQNVGSYQNFYLNDANQTKTFTSDYTGNCTLQVRVSSGKTLNNYIVKPQVELGNQASQFEPYKGQSYTIDLGSEELAKIGTYQDYIWNDDSAWKIHKEVGKVVFDGSETWSLYANNNAFYINKSDAIQMPSASDISLVYCDYYTATTLGLIYDGTLDYGIALGTANHRLNIRNKDTATVADFKTWLSTHNTTVYYALATPTDTEITDSTLISQLEALWEADGYDGATGLFVTATSGASAQLDLCQYPSHIPIATRYKIGAIVVGHGLDIEPDGRLDVIPASADTIGGIKVGNNLTIDENGVLSADAVSITIDDQMSNSSTNPVQNKVITAALATKPDSSSLSTVATSGSYNDLLNKPTIPTVNNATLTIQKNGTTVKTFTANASSNVTANITVPTKTSELSNNSGFLTSESDPVFSASPAASITTQDIDSWTAKSDFSGSYNDLTDKPTIPTVNNATLTIQKNGTNVQTFTANSSTNKTANLEIPVITLTRIDPGEGGSLAANNFIGVYI